jgi:hypothetical protein
MKHSKKCTYTRIFSTRLSDQQFQYLKTKDNFSHYLRKLIADDMAVQNENA